MSSTIPVAAGRLGRFLVLAVVVNDLIVFFVQVEHRVEFGEPRGFGFEFFLVYERLIQFRFRVFKLYLFVIELVLTSRLLFRERSDQVVETLDITEDVRAERSGMPQFVLQRDLVCVYEDFSMSIVLENIQDLPDADTRGR